MALDSLAAMLGSIAQGSLAGKQQAQQEQEEEQRQQQAQTLQAVPMLANLQAQQHNQQMAPWEALSPYANQMDPASRARFLTGYAGAAGQMGPGIDISKMAGAFDEDHPLHGILNSMAAGRPGGAPVMRTLQPGQQLPGQLPPGTPFPGLQPPAPAPPVGGGPVSPTAINTPMGSFNLQGVDEKQRTAALQRFDKIAQTYRDADLDPVEQQRIAGIMNGVNRNPQTPEELQALVSATQQLETGSIGLGPRLATERDRQMDKDLTNYGKRGETLRKGQLTPTQFKQYLRDTIGMEGGLAKYHDKTAQPLGEWSGYNDRLNSIEQGLASNDPGAKRQAAGDLKDLREEVVNQKSPQQVDREYADAMKIIGQMDPRAAVDPKKVAAAVGGVAPSFATRILEEGLSFGGGRGQRLFNQLMGQYKEISAPGVSGAMRQTWLDAVTGAARITGQKINLTVSDLARLDPMEQKRLQKAGLEIEDLKGKIGMQPAEMAEREARLKLIGAQTEHIRQQTSAGKAGKGSQQGLLTMNAQLSHYSKAEENSLKIYEATLKENGLNLDRRFDVQHPRADHPGDQKAAAAYRSYMQNRAVTQRVLAQMNKMLPKERQITGDVEGVNPVTGASGPAPTASSAAAPGGQPASLTPDSAWSWMEQHNTPMAQRNRFMAQHWPNRYR